MVIPRGVDALTEFSAGGNAASSPLVGGWKSLGPRSLTILVTSDVWVLRAEFVLRVIPLILC